MENIFETLAAAFNPETAKMHSDLAHYESMIKELEAKQNGGYTAQVAKSFHLGMVGGSGRNTARLNRIRGNELDKTIDRAVILTGLYKKRDELQRGIEYIESGKRDADLKKKDEKAVFMANYWKQLKAGDEVAVGIAGNTATITKMNIEQLAKESYQDQKQSGKVTLSLANPESSYILGYSYGVLAGMDYADALIKLHGEEAAILNRQDNKPVKIELDEENIRTLHY